MINLARCVLCGSPLDGFGECTNPNCEANGGGVRLPFSPKWWLYVAAAILVVVAVLLAIIR
jgi:hypothetical protein